MVSNVLNLTPEELLTELQRFAEAYKADSDYLALRADLPSDWPI